MHTPNLTCFQHSYVEKCGFLTGGVKDCCIHGTVDHKNRFSHREMVWGQVYEIWNENVAPSRRCVGSVYKSAKSFFSLSILLIAQLRYQILIFLEMKFKITLVVIAVFKNWKWKIGMEPERIKWIWNSCLFPSEAQPALKPGPTVVRTRKPKFLNRDGYEKPRNGRSKCFS